MAKNDTPQAAQTDSTLEGQTVLQATESAEQAAAKERDAVLADFYATGKVRPGFALQFKPVRGGTTEPVVTKLG